MSLDKSNCQNRILVVEDNLTTSKMLVLFLNDAGFSTECAYDGNQAVNRFREDAFDLILLDLMLPDMNGIQVCKTLRESSTVPIVMLTAKSTEDDIVNGLESGADDYVCKPFGSRELLARIRRCLRSQPPKDLPETHASVSSGFRVGNIELNISRREVLVSGQQIRLTRSEFAILETLMKRPGRVFTRDQLLQNAFGPNYDSFERSIDTHIWNLRKKIGEPRGKPRYILSEPGVGYRLNDQHEN